MNSLVVGRYKNTNARNLGGEYREPSIVIARITDNKNGHSMRPNKVAFKYLNLKKNVDPNVHVRVLNYIVKANA